MSTSKRLKSRIQAILTRLFIRFMKRSRFEGTKKISVFDEPVTVYMFSKESAIFAQNTILGTIIWNKENMENKSNKTKQLVLSHELSHRDRNSVYRGIFYGVLLWVAIVGGSLLYSPIYLFFGGSLTAVGLLAGTFVVVSGVFAVLFRIEETWADYHALCEMGEEKFKEAYKEIEDSGPVSFRSRIIRKTLYTHPSNTVRLYRFLR